MKEAIIVWLIVLIACIIVEAITMGLTTVWFAGGALFAILAAALNAPVYLQIIIFLIVSVILLIFTRPIAVRFFNKERVKTNVESMIGKQAIVISEIDNLQGIGQVTVGGQEWSARSVDDTHIEVGAVVEVTAVAGVKLIVAETEQSKTARDGK